jgi:hypothetical protein
MLTFKDVSNYYAYIMAATAADNTPAPLDPAAEEARIKSLIGDKSVVIAREHSSKIKIPGL